MGKGGCQTGKHGLRLSCDQIGECRCNTAVGHMREFALGLELEEFHRQMGERALTR